MNPVLAAPPEHADLYAPIAWDLTQVEHILRDTLASGQTGVAMLLEHLAHFRGKRLSMTALPIKLPVPPRPVGIVTLKNRTLSPAAELFIDCGRQVSKPLAKER